MPAASATVAAYLVELGEYKDDRQPLAISTIQRRKASISEAHKLAGEPNPCLDPLVKQVAKGPAPTAGRCVEQAQGRTVDSRRACRRRRS